MYFSLKFSIWLKWSDNRLEYQNLNEDHFQNIVSKEVAAELWKPVLILENYIGDNVGGQSEEKSEESEVMEQICKWGGASFEALGRVSFSLQLFSTHSKVSF